VFTFGSTVLSYRQADDQIEVARNRLLAAEQDVTFDLLRGYLEVMKSRRILEINAKNKSNLGLFLRQTQTRFDKEWVTKTDVSLAQSRLETAISDYTEAENRVRNAAAEYARVTGEEPNYDLKMPDEVADMPQDLDSIESAARQSNRMLLQSQYAYKAKQEAV